MFQDPAVVLFVGFGGLAVDEDLGGFCGGGEFDFCGETFGKGEGHGEGAFVFPIDEDGSLWYRGI